MPDPVLTIERLSHQYANGAVLDAIDLEIGNGEFVAVLGASGSGKTTLLRAISGLLTPSEGSIRVRGLTVLENGQERVAPEQRGIGLVFQDYALFPHMSVSENIAFGLSTPDPARIGELLSLMGITELSDRSPSTLSGGQQQRVALARALAPRPNLLLLDEPFANVDAERRSELGDAIHKITRAQETATLLVTHDRISALGLADKLVVLVPTPKGAYVAQHGTPIEVYNQPSSPEVASLTGPAFLLQATAQGTEADTCLGRVRLSHSHIGPVTLLLRPENLRFEPSKNGPATLRQSAFEGQHTRLVCDTQEGTIQLFSPSDMPVGTQGHIHVDSPCWAWPAS